jgi:hypothetical protein
MFAHNTGVKNPEKRAIFAACYERTFVHLLSQAARLPRGLPAGGRGGLAGAQGAAGGRTAQGQARAGRVRGGGNAHELPFTLQGDQPMQGTVAPAPIRSRIVAVILLALLLAWLAGEVARSEHEMNRKMSHQELLGYLREGAEVSLAASYVSILLLTALHIAAVEGVALVVRITARALTPRTGNEKGRPEEVSLPGTGPPSWGDTAKRPGVPTPAPAGKPAPPTPASCPRRPPAGPRRRGRTSRRARRRGSPRRSISPCPGPRPTSRRRREAGCASAGREARACWPPSVPALRGSAVACSPGGRTDAAARHPGLVNG